ncbi:MAG: endonuclease domain-containing protein [Atopobiaceae bacterium]|nr:endonuclease domain-containing protein [Atopobiaceae bacterium]
MNRNNRDLTPLSQKLRKNMTEQEARLWYGFLNRLPFRVNRQKVIGNYIVDFYCASKKTVIEIDGGQHFEEEGVRRDMERDEYLRSRGLTVLRYSNCEVNGNFYGVCHDIFARLNGEITEPQEYTRDWILEENCGKE